ncbi:hypothetical protein PRZ48_010015 [Zasmidium cellare]|uniref:Copper transport protein n=1 Tax=Zasmidium cellare TaxID=395010 RepID=A0ABR0EEC7_ZASCE|nr:hypothetical protein PRZ48_010015 [Zasmidium cellare]
MDHGGMDHGGHGDMGDMPMCNMNMLFTWDTTNLCIVFKSWRITGLWSLLWSLLAVIALTAGYEAVREASRRYEQRHAAIIENLPRSSVQAEEQKGKIVKALFYGVQVFYSFFIMLLFMTYNGWIMIAVGIGAFIGYLAFSTTSATKSAACH